MYGWARSAWACIIHWYGVRACRGVVCRPTVTDRDCRLFKAAKLLVGSKMLQRCQRGTGISTLCASKGATSGVPGSPAAGRCQRRRRALFAIKVSPAAGIISLLISSRRGRRARRRARSGGPAPALPLPSRQGCWRRRCRPDPPHRTKPSPEAPPPSGHWVPP